MVVIQASMQNEQALINGKLDLLVQLLQQPGR